MACYQTGMRFNLHAYFRLNGFEITNKLSKADYIIVVTCAVLKYREDVNINYIIKVVKREKKQSAKIIVMGCLPRINRERLGQEEYIIQAQKESELDEIFMSKIKLENIESYHLFSEAYTDLDLAIYNNLYLKLRFLQGSLHGNKCKYSLTSLCFSILKLFNRIQAHANYKSFFILPNHGCAGKCSYCSVRCAVGKVKSKPVEYLVGELNKGLSMRFKYFCLISNDLSSYGTDIRSNFLNLLDAITCLTDDYHLHIRYINPAWIVENLDGFLRILEREKIIKISCPIQSGSQRILDLMCRQYDINKVRKCFQLINASFPHLKISTEVIAGFPSETEEDILETVSFLRSVRFSDIIFFGYSERPNTLSATIPCKVPYEVIKKRIGLLRREFRALAMKACIDDIIFRFTHNFGCGWK